MLARIVEGPDCLSASARDGKVIPHVRGTPSEEPLDHTSHMMRPGVPRFVLFERVPSLYKNTEKSAQQMPL